MPELEANIQKDIQIINEFSVVPLILEAICRTTGMGFAAVARVTDKRWVACSVLDEVKFGLAAGGELKLETTICHEIRQSGEGVIIDHVREDEVYHNHHTPNMYGLQSYISVPIKRDNEEFFGTLCAIDARPALLNTPEIISMFKAYASLISLYLNAVETHSSDRIAVLQERASVALKDYLGAIMQQPQVSLSATAVNTREARFSLLIRAAADKINILIGQLKNM